AIFRLAFHFGLFQSLMTTLGWLLGSTIVALIAAFDHWVAFVLLLYVGINMIRSGLKPDSQSFPSDPSRGALLVMLSVATSLDALAVGLSLAMLRVSILFPTIVIGLTAAGLSLIGLLTGSRLGKTFGKRMEVAGGLTLVGIGTRILFTHL
ncbi:MAG: manganese efflux pump MntP family protein, partial [Anaerolineales bacterium]